MKSPLWNHKAIDEVNRLKRRFRKYRNLYHNCNIIAQAIVWLGSLLWVSPLFCWVVKGGMNCHWGFMNSRKISVFPCTDEIMQQEIRPLVAVDIIEQLHRQFAILSGKKLLVMTLRDSLGDILECVMLTVTLQLCTVVAVVFSYCSWEVLLQSDIHSVWISAKLLYLLFLIFHNLHNGLGGTYIESKKLSKTFTTYLCTMSKHLVCGKRFWSIRDLFITSPFFLICLCFRNDSLLKRKVLIFKRYDYYIVLCLPEVCNHTKWRSSFPKEGADTEIFGKLFITLFWIL